jgi:hypothetical protein
MNTDPAIETEIKEILNSGSAVPPKRKILSIRLDFHRTLTIAVDDDGIEFSLSDGNAGNSVMFKR